MADPVIEVTDDTVVEIQLPDTPAGAAAIPEKKNGGAADGVVATPSAADEAAETLKRTLEEERAKRIAAESMAATERQRAEHAGRLAEQRGVEAKEARESVVAVQMREALASLESAKRDVQSAKAAFTQAHEAGDAGAMADAQERMGYATAAIRHFESKKTELENQATRTAAEPEHTREASPVYENPVENYLANPSFSMRAKSWLRAHTDCLPPNLGGSAEKNAKMLRGHHLALGNNMQLDSDEYYRMIEDVVADRASPPAPAPASAAARTTPATGSQEGHVTRRTPMPSAPATNEPPSPSGAVNVTTRSFKLDKDMQEVALNSWPQKPGEDDRTWKQRAFASYATELAAATAEGKIGRLTH